MFFVCRPIDIWSLKAKERIEIRIVQSEQRLTYVSMAFEEENKCYDSPIDAANAALNINSKLNPSAFIYVLDGETVLLRTKKHTKLLNWANSISLQECKDKQSTLLEEETEFYLD